MNHITFQIPAITSHLKIKKPDELVIFETISSFLSEPITLQHIKRSYKTLVIKLLPSKKKELQANFEQIVETLRNHNIVIEKII